MRRQPRPRRTCIAAAAFSALLSLSPGARAALTDPITSTGALTVRLDTFVSSTAGPTDLVHANDGSARLFLAVKPGQIRLINNGTVQTTPYLNIDALLPEFISTTGNDERGLLGLVFHPNFAAPLNTPGRGKFYTYTSETITGTPDFGYVNHDTTVPPLHHSVLREWTADPTANTYNTASASRILMRVAQPQDNHNGGALRFDNNGLLFIASGDGGGSNDENAGHTPTIGNGQDTTNVLGDILRIDPLHPTLTSGTVGAPSANGQYRIPVTNPFLDGAGPNANSIDEIYAYGFRNPYRISFDKKTGRLFAGDVGQGTREEVDIVQIGQNHGWKYFEGTHIFRSGGPSGTVFPLAEYRTRRNNVGDGNAVIGGFVYRGFRIPELHGKYVFGDLGGLNQTIGRLFYVDPDLPVEQAFIREFQYAPGNAAIDSQVFGLGEGPTGELFLLLGNGAIRKISGGPTQWERDGAGTWGTTSNWSNNAAPNAAGATANFMGGLITPQNAPAVITVDGDKTVGTLRFFNDAVNPNGASPYTYVLNGSVQALRIDGNGAEALITADAGHHQINAGVFQVPTNLRLHAADNASLTFTGQFSNTFGGDIRKTGPGTVRLQGGLSASTATVLDVQQGAVIGTTLSSQQIFVRGGASLTADRIANTLELVIDVGGQATLTPQTFVTGISTVTSLLVAGGTTPTGTFDLNQRFRIINADLVTYAAQIRYAWNNGDYGRPGITSDLAEQSNDTKTIGLLPTGLMDVTWFGDTDLDKDIDADDYHRTDRAFLLRLSGWHNGDGDYSGRVDLEDYGRMDAAFFAQSMSAAPVPEPVAAVPLIVLVGLVGRRRRST